MRNDNMKDNVENPSPIIPPGAYKLARDVANPHPDRRRTRDWRSYPTWKAGWEFVVREQHRDHVDESMLAGLSPEVAARIRAAQTYTVVEMVGQNYPGLHRIGPGADEQYAALAGALVPTVESIEQFMARLDCSNGFMQWLVGQGKISRTDLEQWWHSYQYDDPDDTSEPVSNREERCMAEVNGHVCVYIAGHVTAANATAPRHFNAAVGFWSDGSQHAKNSDDDTTLNEG